MGFAPEQVDRMSIWEFIACMDDGDGKKSGDGMSEARLRELGIEGF